MNPLSSILSTPSTTAVSYFCLALVEMLWNHIKTTSPVEFDKVIIIIINIIYYYYIYNFSLLIVFTNSSIWPLFMRLVPFPLPRWCHLVDILFHARAADKFAKSLNEKDQRLKGIKGLELNIRNNFASSTVIVRRSAKTGLMGDVAKTE